MKGVPNPAATVATVASVHALFFVTEMIRLTFRGHFLIANRIDRLEVFLIGVSGYTALAVATVSLIAVWNRCKGFSQRRWKGSRRTEGQSDGIRQSRTIRAATRLSLFALLFLFSSDHVAREMVGSPFSARFALFVAVFAAGSYVAALIGVRLLGITPAVRRSLADSRTPAALLTTMALVVLVIPVRLPARRSPVASDMPNVILISIDAARSDFFSGYGYEHDTTPAMDRVADAGLAFENAFAQDHWTLPSHASIFTSLYPPEHGVEDVYDRLDDEIPTLAQVMQEAGHRTLALVDSDRWGFVGAARGFDRGFDDYVHYPDNRSAKQAFLPYRISTDLQVLFEFGHAEHIIGSAIRWIERNDDGPFFLFIHLYDVHPSWGARWPLQRLPYRAYEPYIRRVGRESMPSSDRFVMDGDSGARYLNGINERLAAGAIPNEYLGQKDVALLRQLYASSLNFVDSQIGRLDRFLSSRDLAGSTLLILTSDHGEEFLEHRRLGHLQPHKETLQVPLILRGPGVPSGRRLGDIVESIDIAPTILDLCGVKIPESFRGQPLPLDGNGSRAATYMGNQSEGLFAVRTSDSFYVVHGLVSGEPREELYDLQVDPGEHNDLSGREFAALEKARATLRRWLREHPPRQRTKQRIPEDENVRERLRNLGYLE